MERKTENQLICGKRLCRNGLQARSDLSSAVVSASKTIDSIDSKPAPKPDRAIDWAIAVNHARIRAPRRVLDGAHRARAKPGRRVISQCAELGL
jgi:hypothetical protein